MRHLDHTKFENLIHTYAAGTIVQAISYKCPTANVAGPIIDNLQSFAGLVYTGYSPEVIALMYDAALEQALQAIESDYMAELLDSETRNWALTRVLDLPDKKKLRSLLSPTAKAKAEALGRGDAVKGRSCDSSRYCAKSGSAWDTWYIAGYNKALPEAEEGG